MKTVISALVLAVFVAFCQGHTTSGNYNRIVKLEWKVSALSKLVDQIRGKTTRYLGCYKDDYHRLLKLSVVSHDHMTLKWCFHHCRREGEYRYAGLEYHNSCQCGNQLNTAKYPRMSESDCSAPCKGNPTQMCGGAWRLSVWKLK